MTFVFIFFYTRHTSYLSMKCIVMSMYSLFRNNTNIYQAAWKINLFCDSIELIIFYYCPNGFRKLEPVRKCILCILKVLQELTNLLNIWFDLTLPFYEIHYTHLCREIIFNTRFSVVVTVRKRIVNGESHIYALKMVFNTERVLSFHHENTDGEFIQRLGCEHDTSVWILFCPGKV